MGGWERVRKSYGIFFLFFNLLASPGRRGHGSFGDRQLIRREIIYTTDNRLTTKGIIMIKGNEITRTLVARGFGAV